MILLTVNEIISLHSKLIQKTGGSDGIRDLGLLTSAVYSASNSFDNVEQYPSIEEKAARLCFAIISNHSFVDGNKRIGILVLVMTLKLNNIKITFSQDSLVNLGLSIADGRCKYECVYKWILDNKSMSLS